MASIEVLQKPIRTVNAKRKIQNKMETAQMAGKNGKASIDARGLQDVSAVSARLAVKRKAGRTYESYS